LHVNNDLYAAGDVVKKKPKKIKKLVFYCVKIYTIKKITIKKNFYGKLKNFFCLFFVFSGYLSLSCEW
jgi:hypothetical protein